MRKKNLFLDENKMEFFIHSFIQPDVDKSVSICKTVGTIFNDVFGGIEHEIETLNYLSGLKKK